MTSNGGKPAMQLRSSNKRKQENRKMEDALTSMIRESSKSRQELTKNMNQEKPLKRSFLKLAVLRMKKLQTTTKSFIRLKNIAVVCKC